MLSSAQFEAEVQTITNTIVACAVIIIPAGWKVYNLIQYQIKTLHEKNSSLVDSVSTNTTNVASLEALHAANRDQITAQTTHLASIQQQVTAIALATNSGVSPNNIADSFVDPYPSAPDLPAENEEEQKGV